jgi:hypothetical protein
MALVNSVWRIGSFVPKGEEPGLTAKFPWRDIEHEKATQAIAKARFNFPDIEYPDLKSYTNRPARQVGVVLRNSKEMAFPDIVALADPSNEVRIIGEIETHRSLRDTPEAELVEKWREFSFLGETYLFVPLMQVSIVKAILKRNKVKLAGVRSWRFITGQDKIDVVDMR